MRTPQIAEHCRFPVHNLAVSRDCFRYTVMFRGKYPPGVRPPPWLR
jgi:hypothetical protein